MLDRYANPEDMITLAKSNEPMPERYSGSAPGLGRYFFDERLPSREGWAQVDNDQDASYYGTWTSARNLTVVSYCEGDVFVRRYPDKQAYIKAIREHAGWDRFKGIDAYRTEQDFIDLGLQDILH